MYNNIAIKYFVDVNIFFYIEKKKQNRIVNALLSIRVNFRHNVNAIEPWVILYANQQVVPTNFELESNYKQISICHPTTDSIIFVDFFRSFIFIKTYPRRTFFLLLTELDISIKFVSVYSI